MQPAPLYELGVRCRPKFDGNNGGRTHKGVTGTEIRYTWYNPPENPVLNGLLAQAGLAREIPPFCDAMIAYEKSLQKYFEMSGRKLVAVDGPGSNAGSAGCDGKYKFFQSNCSSNSPDLPCLRGDGKIIGEQMNVAFVLAPRGHSVVFEELALRQTFAIGYNGTRPRFQQFAPFLWGDGLSQERVYALHSEYYCNRLAGQEPAYGGSDVKSLPGGRKIGIAWPDTADGVRRALVESWLATLRRCGADAKSYTYEADVSRAAQQAQSLVGQMRSDGITTVTWCCDPVSYVFLLQALNQNRYYPEHYILPVAAIASDVAGNTYEDAGFGDQWAHAFGISELAVNKNDDDPAYRRAYADGSGPGGKEGVPAIENESFKAMHQMMQMIHSAGPGITPRNVFDGMEDLPPIAPSILTPGFDYKAPDPFQAQLDVAEVWWNPNLYSYYSDTNGAMCYMNNGARYEPGRVPRGPANLFTGNGACARLKPGT
jgi:hypothetical protein